jgi:hypothetical protein
MARKEVQVIAREDRMARFTVPFGTREELVAAIAAKLRSGEEIVWTASSEGINVVCVYEDQPPWRPRTRFFPTDNGSSQLLIEDKSDEATE